MADQTSGRWWPRSGDPGARFPQAGRARSDRGAMDGSWPGLVAPGGSGESMATHFDSWCRDHGISLDDFGARESVQHVAPATGRWEPLPDEVADWMGLDESMVPFALDLAH